ncbi:hypothetical protein M569_14497 [Genlisea aurea]|uniref:Remorin C-terminal domain-containing protein n=1 Tax=Genlisea aurea TaxID=192259 RepID=S8DLA7_9LAMI|nr:hypothetical protein M569_14497 [Genlisea aurea]
MAEEEAKKVEPEESAPAAEPPKDVAEEKTIVAAPTPTPTEEKLKDEFKALAVADEKPAEPVAEESKPDESTDRDIVLARVATEKRLSLIKAWEESEKSKAENKAQKKKSAVGAWENSKKAKLEAELKKIEEEFEKKKAEYVEKIRNKVALVHKAAEEKRAVIEARRSEDHLKAEEIAAKYRATGTAPKKLLGIF